MQDRKNLRVILEQLKYECNTDSVHNPKKINYICMACYTHLHPCYNKKVTSSKSKSYVQITTYRLPLKPPYFTMSDPKPPYRVGRDTFETDEIRLHRALERYDEGKGLIGGDPSRRPSSTKARPDTLTYAFRLFGSGTKKLERLRQFLSEAPLEIEIGSGRGEFILDRAVQHPDRHFVAFEVKTKLMRRIAKRAQRQGLENIWVSDDDARYTLPRLLSPASVDVFHILFPDPWWKPKHQIRRVFIPPFVDVLAILLRPNGLLRAATDVPGYAIHIRELLEVHAEFHYASSEAAERFASATPTDRQVFCDEIGRTYEYLYFTKTDKSLSQLS